MTPLQITWIVYGDLAQPTGGYVYDRLVVEGLRALGDDVRVLDPARLDPGALSAPVIVGDGLCARELGPAFEAAPRSTRVLLVHHFASWEVERADGDALRPIEARAARASDALLATSAATAARVRADLPGRSVEVAVPGADRLPALPRLRPQGGPVEALFVGSLIPRKRLALLLDALERVPEPRLVLRLVGDPERDPAHARALALRVARSSALGDRVIAAGVADEGTLARCLAEADALVLPSSLEGYGMVVTEALHAGLPALVSREARAAAEIDHPAVLAFDGARELATLLERLLDDAERARLSRLARAVPLPRWADTVHDFRAALVRAARARAAGRPAP